MRRAIGANGSGKSTAVRTIAGLLEPSEGSVRIAGHDPHVEPDGELARAALALVPDTPLLYDDLTVRQHLELVDARARRRGRRRRSGSARCSTGSGSPRAPTSSPPSSRAACARRRAGVRARPAGAAAGARRARRRARPAVAGAARELLLEAKRAGTAVLLTTHQMRFADGVADRALLLDEGKVLDRGAWRDVRLRAERRGWVPEGE